MPTTEGRYAARRVTGLEGLEGLRDAWFSLHEGAGLCSRYEWHLALAKHLLEGPALAYVQVLDGKRTVAIVPTIADTVSIPLFGRMRVLGLGMSEIMPLADFPIAPDASAENVATALWASVASSPAPWAALHWPRVLATSDAMRVARALGATADVRAATPCDVLDTTRPAAEALAGCSKNLRVSLRKSLRRLDQQGGAHAIRNGTSCWPAQGGAPDTAGSEDPGRIREAFESFLAVEASGWKGGKGEGTAIALDPATRAFFEELVGLRSAQFAPEVFLLVHGGRAIAGQFTVRVNRSRYTIKIGYDEAQARFSPGQTLLAITVEDACGLGLTDVNLITSLAWHAAWRPVRLPTCHVLIFRERWRAVAYKASRDAWRRVKGIVGRKASPPC